MEYWGEGWRPYLVRLLHDMRPIRVEPEPWAALSDPTAAFVAEVVTPDKIARGRAHAAEAWLREIASRRGIPAVVLAAVWGAESDFGRREGAYDLLAFWATRASVGDSIRDPDFGEAAKIVVAGDIPRARLRAFPDGSTGQVRWFPKQYMEMAVDADDDSVRDIWRSRIDAMDSVAARLAGAWRAGEWLVEVEVPQGQDIATQRLLRGARTPSGVQPDYFRRKDGRPWAAEDLRNGGRLLEPYGPGGPAYLGFGNLQVLQYLAGDYRGRFPGEDRAAPWALAIGLLANRIAGR
jgi:membrane-bound lytic murein transglycosylase B